MTTNSTPPAPGELPPPRWAVRAAHVVAWSTVPSGVWRIALVLGVPVGVMEREEFLAGFPGHSPLVAMVGGLLTAPSPDPGISAGEILFVASYAPLLLWGRCWRR